MGTPKWLERTELLVGEESLARLHNANILLVGLGGVGSFAGEFLVRAGIGHLTIIDGDIVDPTNKNRQLPALDSTAGKPKADVLGTRFLDINPDLRLTIILKFMEPEDMSELLEKQRFDFVLDCIDSITPKVTLIKSTTAAKTKIISSMGAGGKLDPSKVEVTDISNTKECKFAKMVRKMLKKDRIYRGVIAVYSDEIQPKDALQLTDGKNYKKSFYGTISYMPALFGLHMAAEVIRRIGDLK